MLFHESAVLQPMVNHLASTEVACKVVVLHELCGLQGLRDAGITVVAMKTPVIVVSFIVTSTYGLEWRLVLPRQGCPGDQQ